MGIEWWCYGGEGKPKAEPGWGSHVNETEFPPSEVNNLTGSLNKLYPCFDARLYLNTGGAQS